jgi:hypothetical protein
MIEDRRFEVKTVTVNGICGLYDGRDGVSTQPRPIQMHADQVLSVAKLGLLCMFLVPMTPCAGQQNQAIGIGNWLTLSANLDAGYRRTQFFDPQYNTVVFQWDSRAEFWLPPFRNEFSWGPYIRIAEINGSQSEAWQNAWLGGPGLGFQVYPLSSSRFTKRDSAMRKLFGPTRFFAEYNFTHYWGANNQWRPRNQERIGFDYWKAVNVNDQSRYWWAEIWNGLYWQSGNEFTDRYDTIVFANAGRFGLRKARSGLLSAFTPYLALESSRTKNDQYYWDNRLLLGGGLRFAPSLRAFARSDRAWLSRCVVYGEYLNAATYYGAAAPSSIPRFDVRVGVSASMGDWYK